MPKTDARGGPSGVTIIDKPKGATSFDLVARARRFYGTRRVGHAGTLDPMATGVLVLLLGEGTKLSAALTGADKEYEAEVTFGLSTDTLDAEGAALDRSDPADVPTADLEEALEVECRREWQTPPAHSAIKVAGHRAYALARRGVDVELEPRSVRVLALDLLSHSADWARVRLRVSKGYYVRAFARDVCSTLGVPGHLSALRRTQSGCFSIDEASPWPPPDAAPPLSLESAVRRALPCSELTEDGQRHARHGKALDPSHFHDARTELSGWFAPDGSLVALGEKRGESFRVTRGFAAALSRDGAAS